MPYSARRDTSSLTYGGSGSYRVALPRPIRNARRSTGDPGRSGGSRSRRRVDQQAGHTCGAPAAGSRVQGCEHASQGNLAVRGIGELADLIPVDRAGLEIEGEPAARTEVRRRVEPPVLEQ